MAEIWDTQIPIYQNGNPTMLRFVGALVFFTAAYLLVFFTELAKNKPASLQDVIGIVSNPYLLLAIAPIALLSIVVGLATSRANQFVAEQSSKLKIKCSPSTLEIPSMKNAATLRKQWFRKEVDEHTLTPAAKRELSRKISPSQEIPRDYDEQLARYLGKVRLLLPKWTRYNYAQSNRGRLSLQITNRRPNRAYQNMRVTLRIPGVDSAFTQAEADEPEPMPEVPAMTRFKSHANPYLGAAGLVSPLDFTRIPTAKPSNPNTPDIDIRKVADGIEIVISQFDLWPSEKKDFEPIHLISTSDPGSTVRARLTISSVTPPSVVVRYVSIKVSEEFPRIELMRGIDDISDVPVSD